MLSDNTYTYTHAHSITLF